MKKALGLWVVGGLVDTFTGRKFFYGAEFFTISSLKKCSPAEWSAMDLQNYFMALFPCGAEAKMMKR
jgi:hypothetical protein